MLRAVAYRASRRREVLNAQQIEQLARPTHPHPVTTRLTFGPGLHGGISGGLLKVGGVVLDLRISATPLHDRASWQNRSSTSSLTESVTALIRVGRDFHLVLFFQKRLDLAHRHPLGVHGDNLGIEAPKAPLSLADKLRLKLPSRISGHLDIQLSIFAEQALFARPVAMLLALLLSFAFGRLALLVNPNKWVISAPSTRS